MESVWSVSKLSTESVGSRRELVANCVHTADETRLDSFFASASAVCIGLNRIHDSDTWRTTMKHARSSSSSSSSAVAGATW